MKHLQSFETFTYENDELIEEGLFSSVDTKTKFKTILTYYTKKGSGKNLKYWLEALVQQGITSKKLIGGINNQYNKLKPSFGATPSGAISSNTGEFDLIKKMKEDPNYFDGEIKKMAEKYVPNDVEKIVTGLDLK